MQLTFYKNLLAFSRNHEETVRSSTDEAAWIEEYTRLMADIEPERMSNFVQTVDSQYLPLVRDICHEHSLVDAEAALLERQGDVAAAYELLLAQMQSSIRQLFERADSWADFQQQSQRVIDFCLRQGGAMSESEREKIWLTLLDELLSPQKLARNQPDTSVIMSGNTCIFLPLLSKL